MKLSNIYCHIYHIHGEKKKFHPIHLLATIIHGCEGETNLCTLDSWLQRRKIYENWLTSENQDLPRNLEEKSQFLFSYFKVDSKNYKFYLEYLQCSIQWLDHSGSYEFTALQSTSLHWTALHCTAHHCTALHCTSLHCTALHCTALCCAVLHCTALHCTVLCCAALQYSALH